MIERVRLHLDQRQIMQRIGNERTLGIGTRMPGIPEDVRPRKNQPFYHLLAENDESSYVAYVSQQNLILDGEGEPVQHPAVAQMFSAYEDGRYKLRPEIRN